MKKIMWAIMSFSIVFLLASCQSSDHPSLQKGVDAMTDGQFKEATKLLKESKDEQPTDETAELLEWAEDLYTYERQLNDDDFDRAKTSLDNLQKKRFKDVRKEFETAIVERLDEEVDRFESKKSKLVIQQVNQLMKDKEWAKAKEFIASIDIDELSELEQDTLKTHEATIEEQLKTQEQVAEKKEEEAKESKKTSNRQAIIDSMESQVNLHAYLDGIVDVLIGSFDMGDTSYSGLEAPLSNYLGDALAADTANGFRSGQLCVYCDMEIFPGLFGYTFNDYVHVSEGRVDVSYSTSYGTTVYTYGLENGRWKILNYNIK